MAEISSAAFSCETSDLSGGQSRRLSMRNMGSTVKGKRLEFVSAKRAASPLQGRAATIERTEHRFDN